MAETEHGIYYPTTEDPVRAPADMQKLAESIDSKRLTAAKGKLLIAQNTGAAVWEAMKGDATLAEDGTLTAKDHSASLWVPGQVTRASSTLGSFSTGLKVELPVVLANQFVEARIFCGGVASSIESTNETTGGKLKLSFNGTGITIGLWKVHGESALPANAFIPCATISSGKFAQAGSRVRGEQNWGEVGVAGFVASAEAKNFVVELQGASTSGTITAEAVLIQARVWG